MSKRVFVSGGAGVIGRELVPKLIDKGYEVFVGDLVTRPNDFDEKVIYRQGDLNLLSFEEIEEFSPNYFIHLAATFERSIETYEFWNENFKHNISLSNHLASLVKDLSSLERIVYASSYLIYDKHNYQFEVPQNSAILLNESMPIKPRNLTGMAKLAHEIELEFLQNHKGNQFTSVSARIYRGYGKNSRDVISRWIRDLLKEREIEVFRPEGIFDYMFSRDSAEGLIRLMENNEVEGVVNLGTGKPRKVYEVLEILKTHFPNMKTKSINTDIPYEASGSDNSLLRKTIKWEPEFKLETTIPEIIEFEKANYLKTDKLNAFNILVTSSGDKVPLIKAIKEAANRFEEKILIIAGDISNKSLSKYFCDSFWTMPTTVEKNLDEILNYCLKQNVKIIVPTRDGELFFWSKYKGVFENNGISIIVSKEHTINLCLDKYQFYKFCLEQKIPAIETSLKIDGINSSKKYVVKERYGSGSSSIGLALDYEEAQNWSCSINTPIFQPYLEGKEISCDGYVDKTGKLKGLVLRERIDVRNGESQITKTFKNNELERIISRAVSKFDLYGPFVLQAFIQNNDSIQLIEINSRFGGASTTSIKAGLDIFYWVIAEKLNYDLSLYPFRRSTKEVKLIRTKNDYFTHDPSI